MKREVYDYCVIYRSQGIKEYYYWIPYVSREKFKETHNSKHFRPKIFRRGLSKESAKNLCEKLNNGSGI